MFSTTGSFPVQCSTESFLTRLDPRASILCDRGPWAGGRTAPALLRMQPGSASTRLNKSLPTSESIQAAVNENKQAFARTERRKKKKKTQLNHSQREHAAEGSLPNLFCRFQALFAALIVPLLPSPLEPRQSRRSACHMGRLQFAYNCGRWERITMAGTA